MHYVFMYKCIMYYVFHDWGTMNLTLLYILWSYWVLGQKLMVKNHFRINQSGLSSRFFFFYIFMRFKEQYCFRAFLPIYSSLHWFYFIYFFAFPPKLSWIFFITYMFLLLVFGAIVCKMVSKGVQISNKSSQDLNAY